MFVFVGMCLATLSHMEVNMNVPVHFHGTSLLTMTHQIC